MLNNQIATATVLINATPEKVWEGLTKPELIKEYLFGTDTVTDWKVGSPIVFQGEYNGQSYRDHGMIKTNDPYTKLAYSYWSGFTGLPDLPENYCNITYSLEPGGDTQTKFTWTQQGFANAEACDHSNAGMKDFVNTIKTTVENHKP